ncbi:MAG: hypothetical protein K2Q14_01165 [Gammaproteobacteria bacterium]|nr:hypothetical protein [Gammaproteobacteria bacterium]
MKLVINGVVPPYNTGIIVYNTSKGITQHVWTIDSTGTFWLPTTEGPNWQGDSMTCADPVFACNVVQVEQGNTLYAASRASTSK